MTTVYTRQYTAEDCPCRPCSPECDHMEAAESFKEWLFDTLDKETREDLANHGADAGFTGLIYTKDCADLFDQFEDEIWNSLMDDAEEYGAKNVCEFMGGFQRSDMFFSIDGLKNLAVWYMAEKLCNEEQNEN